MNDVILVHDVLVLLIVAHLFGDFVLQNDWMQAKSRSSRVCAVHVLAYSVPFWLLFYPFAISPFIIWSIMAEHFLQDRFALHLKWMRLYNQTPPNKWPVGPLCVDQVWHIFFITVFYLIWT